MLTSNVHNAINNENGNVLVIILLAIALIGALTAAISGSSNKNANIDDETLILRVTEIQRYTSELESGIMFIMQNGLSESDIRFAHPNANSDYGDLSADTDKSDQLFHRDGGNATYKMAPDGINDGSSWEFYGNTALPEVGSDEADLIAVLPNVTSAFCDQANEMIGYSAQPQDSSTCINTGASARFDNGTQFDSSPNTVVTAGFSIKPSTRGCVECTSDGSLHYFHVLMAR
ncbi:MAG: hypothetical protein ACRBDI_08065 [Alphaproteobacteria bacterium]